MATTTGRTVFVLGKELHGNRQVVIVEDGQEYNFDAATILPYTNQTARFPYEV